MNAWLNPAATVSGTMQDSSQALAPGSLLDTAHAQPAAGKAGDHAAAEDGDQHGEQVDEQAGHDALHVGGRFFAEQSDSRHMVEGVNTVSVQTMASTP